MPVGLHFLVAIREDRVVAGCASQVQGATGVDRQPSATWMRHREDSSSVFSRPEAPRVVQVPRRRHLRDHIARTKVDLVRSSQLRTVGGVTDRELTFDDVIDAYAQYCLDLD